MNKSIQLPTIREIRDWLISLKAEIHDSHKDHPGDLPSMQVTLAADEKGYAVQTGDNSYGGPAYCHRYWGVGTLYRRSNSAELARNLIDQIKDQNY